MSPSCCAISWSIPDNAFEEFGAFDAFEDGVWLVPLPGLQLDKQKLSIPSNNKNLFMMLVV
ncbi:MAG TPA: hypothetical protein DCQ08_03605 [Amoebophilaceae bacterium]|nr:hypothetical protein [Amoebophilaceae bacterium]